MTQNDIAYYNARKEAKDARLRRKETKRHDIASESTERTKAAASYLGAQASLLSSEAAARNAATNELNYQLSYASEYGYQPSEYVDGFWYYDPASGTVFDPAKSQKGQELHDYSIWLDGKDNNIIIETPKDPKTGGRAPVSYYEKVVRTGQTVQDTATKESQETKNFWDTLKSGAGTVQIIVDTASNILFGTEERNKKGGR